MSLPEPKRGIHTITKGGDSMLIKNVGLFEGRHPYPEFVKDYIFPKNPAWGPLDFDEYQLFATERLLKWKSEGITGINVYLSGLTTAVIAVLNACFHCKMYAKLFHANFLTDTWLAQPVDFFDSQCNYKGLATNELKNYEEFKEVDKKLTIPEKTEIVKEKRKELDLLATKPRSIRIISQEDAKEDKFSTSIADILNRKLQERGEDFI